MFGPALDWVGEMEEGAPPAPEPVALAEGVYVGQEVIPADLAKHSRFPHEWHGEVIRKSGGKALVRWNDKHKGEDKWYPVVELLSTEITGRGESTTPAPATPSVQESRPATPEDTPALEKIVKRMGGKLTMRSTKGAGGQAWHLSYKRRDTFLRHAAKAGIDASETWIEDDDGPFFDNPA